ncbi:hypothetical protein A2U01_0060162, partial [Trifolium medium]|nr:hypothetical protein [Trifolium medium]
MVNHYDVEEKFICLEPSGCLLAMLRLLRFFSSYNIA